MGFTLKCKNDMAYYTIDEFEKTGLVTACFSTKKGGVSKGIYESMNLKFGIGDNDENVRENYRRLSAAIGVEYESLVLLNQIHSDKVVYVTREDRGKGFTKECDDADALITNDPFVTLVTGYADCTPVYLFDKRKKAIGLVHSGWKGTVLEISSRTVEAMTDKFGTDPNDITAAIGPAIGVCHFQIGTDVAEKFKYVFGNSVLVEKKDGIYADMPKAVGISLQKSGVRDIVYSGICTYCKHDLLFSHRQTKGKRGGLAAIMRLNG